MDDYSAKHHRRRRPPLTARCRSRVMSVRMGRGDLEALISGNIEIRSKWGFVPVARSQSFPFHTPGAARHEQYFISCNISSNENIHVDVVNFSRPSKLIWP